MDTTETRHDGSWLDDLIRRATEADGQPPFSDQSRLDLAAGQRELVALGHDAAAIVSDDGEAHEAEFVVHPDARRHGLGGQLLSTLLERSNGTVLLWAHGDHPGARALARRHRLEPVRTLLQMRAVVPQHDASSLRDGGGAPPRGTTPFPGRTVTAFRPGTDAAGTDAADWLALNAKAFASHPEQGKLTQRDLDARMAEAWFDAGDFLLLRDDKRSLIGFCWLKVEDALGEFYAVGVDPDRQGEGLGRVLVAAGLARLAARGIRESNLYVEADNAPAVRLYRSFGFTDYTVDIQYARRR